MGSWPAWTKRLEIGIARERRTEPQVEHQSERRTMGHVQAANCNTWLTGGNVPRETQAASNTRQTAKVRASRGRRSPTRNSKYGAGFEEEKCGREPSPAGDKEQPPWHKYLKETCTDPSCDCWHPPDYVKHNTKEGFDFGAKCAFLRRGQRNSQNKKTTREREVKSDKASVVILRIFQTVGMCISGY